MINKSLSLLIISMFFITSCSDPDIVTLEIRGKIKDKFRCEPIKYNEKYDGLKCNEVNGSSIIKLVEVSQDYRQLNNNLDTISPIELNYALSPTEVVSTMQIPFLRKIGKKNYIIVESLHYGGVEYDVILPSCLDGLIKPKKRLTLQQMGDEAASMISNATGKKIVWAIDIDDGRGRLRFYENEVKNPREALYVTNDMCGVNSLF